MRQPKQLLLDSRQFAVDDRARSWFHVATALLLQAAAIAVCVSSAPLWVRIPASVLAGLALVRLFVIYHDYAHQTILKGSKLATAIMSLYGLATLNPPSIWTRSHNHHHKNNAKVFGASIGSYPVMTTGAWERATSGERFAYLAMRHPLTIAAGYLTVFLYGMTIRSLINNPREHWDSALSLVLHGSMLGAAFMLGGIDVMLLAVVLPFTIGSALGGYLFYAQHNYPGMKIRDRSEWDYVFAALHSSSYMPMNPVMAWFTGNIGYHHVHHLNHKIPFYKLPATMAFFPELQSPGRTSLWPWDVARCLRLKLWDPQRDRLITLAEHRRYRAEAAAIAIVTEPVDSSAAA